MTTQQFLKGLLMALMAVVVVAFSQTPIMWATLIITLIGTALLYAGKNAFTALQSDSPAGSLSWKNIVSALLVAIGSGIIESVALIAGTGAIDWLILGKVVLSITFTYLGGTLFAPPYNTVKKRLFVTPKKLAA